MRTILGMVAVLCVAACSGGGTGEPGAFQLVEFLESGKDELPRNRNLTFVFSAPVAASQDLAERVKIQNSQVGTGGSNFAQAIGEYVVLGDRILFSPRLPQRPDRSDAGFRSGGEYHVFLKAGPDSLVSDNGDPLPFQQNFIFNTSDFFEDPIPAQPPRGLTVTAFDVTTRQGQDLSRLEVEPSALAARDNNDLVLSGLALEPGAGGAPSFSTAWRFDLRVTEPVDPGTVTAENIRLTEIRHDALTTATTADPGHFGDAVNFPVPIAVETIQGRNPDAGGAIEFIVRVTPLVTLVDDARYRLEFSGGVRGIDFRKSFIGDNGLSGAAQGAGGLFLEPGGIGYVTEFVVFDRPAITSSRAVTYDPVTDGIHPELGETSSNEVIFNTALYNPVTAPGRAVGFLGAFGDGSDGNLAVSGATTMMLDTGDTPNEPSGNPFSVIDLDPNDNHLDDTRPGAPVTYDTPTPTEFKFENLTISSSATLQITGMNPVIFRVSGLCQINGTILASGGDGGDGVGSATAVAGTAGPGGFAGGMGRPGSPANCNRPNTCVDFSVYLNNCSQLEAAFPASDHGSGPGRGMAGGEIANLNSSDTPNTHGGSGGGGASHATAGTRGEDRRNSGGAPGTSGPSCSGWNTRNSGVIGVRGEPGEVYGDRELADILMGGSGGGAGGAAHIRLGTTGAGGAGGGGGGSLSILSAGPIIATGGRIEARGGDGGNGFLLNNGAATFAFISPVGGGGGGAGGSIALISGATIDLSGASIDARGGVGGLRGNVGTTTTCNACNGGGDGGDGFLFLMDADGEIRGLNPGSPGEYDDFTNGVLTIQAFDTDRFDTIAATTRLFSMSASDPLYQPMSPGDIVGNAASGQRIRIFVSSAQRDGKDVVMPDPSTEIAPFEVAVVSSVGGGSSVTITGDMSALNPGGTRDAFVRIRAVFEYDNDVEAALGPFASLDEITITFAFNG